MFYGFNFSFLLIALILSSESVARSESPPQASTLNELIARFDGSSCKECHEPIYTQWEKSHHARPLMGLDDQIFMTSYLKRGPLAIKPGEKATRKNFPCFKCHLPQIEYTTDAVAAEIAEAILKDDKATLRKLNISCLVCHNEKAVVHGHPEPNVLYGNKDVPDHQGQVVNIQATDARSNHMVLGPDKKLGIIRDTSIQPFTPKEETFEIPLPAGVKDAVLEVNLSYQPRPGNVYPVYKVVRKVSLGSQG